MSSAELTPLAAAVARAVEALSGRAVATLISGLRGGLSSEVLRTALPTSAYTTAVDDLLSVAGETSPESVALALASVVESRRNAARMEVVWTGPTTPAVSVRRTDQALLQLINRAAKRVIVVSFAVYKVPNVAATLQQAAKLGLLVAGGDVPRRVERHVDGLIRSQELVPATDSAS